MDLPAFWDELPLASSWRRVVGVKAGETFHLVSIKSFGWTQVNALLLNDDSGLMVTI